MNFIILFVAISLWIAVLGMAGELGPTISLGVDGVRVRVAPVECGR